VTHLLVTATIFQPLVDVFDAVLKAIHSVIGGSWGWSIVLLTVIVRALLLPLTVKQFHSMQKLQRLTPELKRIQAKYKEDKQRQQQELMKLYQEHGVSPFSSCLPLVAQLPVFIGLYYTLRTSLRGDICPQIQPHHIVNGHSVVNAAHTVPCGPHGGASFLFIPDLTNKATGAVLVTLLILYVGTQLASSLMMSTPQMDKNQRRLMLLLPLVFVFVVIGFPAGVLVYWITTNLWTMGQQYFIKRRLGPVTPIAATADGDAAAARSAPVKGESTPAPNGASGGLGGLLRGLTKGDEQRDREREPVSTGSRSPRTTAPPPPPRKKKKRSGRRR
jgi:YidC/Oxa1 family membrane protein insertase